MTRTTMHEIKEVVFHHTAGPRGQTFEAIRAYHMAPSPRGRGYADIACHYVILGDATVRVGRALPLMGAHAYGRNRVSIGVAITGDNTRAGEEWTPQQIEAARRLLAALRTVWPQLQVAGHRDVMRPGYTLCPGLDVAPILEGAVTPR